MKSLIMPKHEQKPGLFVPVINRNKCEGKETCVAACPYGVLIMGVLPKEERTGLSTVGKIKGFGHGWRQAFIARGEACTACGLCVQSCPEKAITLRRVAVENQR